jgi:hypothetical protein
VHIGHVVGGIAQLPHGVLGTGHRGIGYAINHDLVVLTVRLVPSGLASGHPYGCA